MVIKNFSKMLMICLLVYVFYGCNKENSFMKGIGPIPGGTYYVATWGNDTNNGSFDKPWATWQKAFETANAGETVYFRGGVYRPAKASHGNNITMIAPKETTPIGHTGTAGNPICYYNYPGETPILDCSRINPTGTFNTGIDILEAHYLKFRGLTVRSIYQYRTGVQAFGIVFSKCSNFTFENVAVHDISGNAIRFGSTVGYFGIVTDTLRFINCDAYSCYDTFNVHPGNAADGWKGDGEPGGYIYWEGCRAWHNSDDGYDLSGDAIGVWKNCWAIGMGCTDCLDGNGYKGGGVRDSLPGNLRIYIRCIAAFNAGAGFYDLDYDPYYRTNGRYYNNTSYNNGMGYYGIPNNLGKARPRTTTYINNLVYKSTNTGSIGERIEVALAYMPYPLSNNTWVWKATYPFWSYSDTLQVTSADFESLVPEGVLGPRKPDGSLPDINFLKLAQGSHLINAGKNVGIPFKGSAPDIGAMESNY